MRMMTRMMMMMEMMMRRSRDAGGGRGRGGRREGRRLKSNNPNLTGGEKQNYENSNKSLIFPYIPFKGILQPL